MSRENRAKQFAPFDALKGLQNALRVKEYEYESIQRGDLQEEQIAKISKVLLDLKKGDLVNVRYYCDGHNKEISGNVKTFFEEHCIQVDAQKIPLEDILDLKKIK